MKWLEDLYEIYKPYLEYAFSIAVSPYGYTVMGFMVCIFLLKLKTAKSPSKKKNS